MGAQLLASPQNNFQSEIVDLKENSILTPINCNCCLINFCGCSVMKCHVLPLYTRYQANYHTVLRQDQIIVTIIAGIYNNVLECLTNWKMFTHILKPQVANGISLCSNHKCICQNVFLLQFHSLLKQFNNNVYLQVQRAAMAIVLQQLLWSLKKVAVPITAVSANEISYLKNCVTIGCQKCSWYLQSLRCPV